MCTYLVVYKVFVYVYNVSLLNAKRLLQVWKCNNFIQDEYNICNAHKRKMQNYAQRKREKTNK